MKIRVDMEDGSITVVNKPKLMKVETEEGGEYHFKIAKITEVVIFQKEKSDG